MPSYEQLRDEADKHGIEDALKKMVEVHGVHVLNGAYPRLTIAQRAVSTNWKELTDSIKEIAQKNEMELALNFIDNDGKKKNLLREAIDNNATGSVEKVFELMKDGVVPFDRAAAAMKECWKALCRRRFREVFRRALINGSFVRDACQVSVNLRFLYHKLRKEDGVHLDTASLFLDWRLCKDYDSRASKWHSKNQGQFEKFDDIDFRARENAQLRFVCIGDAAKPGMGGIIRPLLLSKAPDRFFESDPVKWVVECKWHQVWKVSFARIALRFALCVGSVTVYSTIIGGTSSLSEKDYATKVAATVLVCVNFGFGFIQFKQEMAQLQSLYIDGKQVGSRFAGAWYYFSSWWNIVDLVICFLLLVCIPTTHILEMIESGHSILLSASTAIASVLVYVKVWYFAQAFQQTGAQVLMVSNIVRDSLSFLFLALVILCGFAFGLRVLFRHTAAHNRQKLGVIYQSDASTDTHSSSLYTDEDDVQQAYGTAWRSLGTLFYALIGDFDPAMYYSAEEVPWLVSGLFIIYLISIVILLLNLLISTMGDTFDRVKSTEATQLLIGRAKIIDACEATMSESEAIDIERRSGKYVHAVVCSNGEDDDQPSDGWMGKLGAIDRGIRKNAKRSKLETKELLEEQKASIIEDVEARLSRSNETLLVELNSIKALLSQLQPLQQEERI